MSLNNPFFADISTYSPQKTISFYKNVFGWNYYKNDNYYSAFIENKEITGLYETPMKFKQMRMPYFWMTYIKVDNVGTTVEKSRQLGGIIEIQYEMGSFGKVALIRDPQGAGFTIYEGKKLKNTRTENTKNTLIWNELHVSNIQKVIPFYQGILQWKIIQNKDKAYKVINTEGDYVADMLEIQNQYKGKYEYWVCIFGVEDVIASKKLILENGGSLISKEKDRMMFADNSNEAFFYIRAV